MATLADPASARFMRAASGFRRQRSADFTMMVGLGENRLLLTVVNGAVEQIRNLADLRPLTAWDFAVTADNETWSKFWEAVPSAGWHDLFALTRNGHMRIEGNLHPFMAHLQFIKDLLASPREAQA